MGARRHHLHTLKLGAHQEGLQESGGRGEAQGMAGYVCSDPGAYTTSCCFDAATACNGTARNCGSSCTSKHTPRMRPPSPAGRCRWLCAPAHPAAGSCRPAAPAPAPTRHPAAQCRGQSPRPWRLGRRVQAWVENDCAAAAMAGGGGGARSGGGAGRGDRTLLLR